VEIVTFAEIQKVKSSFEFKNSISSTLNCNEFRFFEPRFTSLTGMYVYTAESCKVNVCYTIHVCCSVVCCNHEYVLYAVCGVLV